MSRIKTYTVRVTVAKDAHVSGSRIATAVWGTAKRPEDFRNVEVVEVDPTAARVNFVAPLYALGRKGHKGWKLVNYFNCEGQAEYAVEESAVDYKSMAMHGEFAVLYFDPEVWMWKKVGKSTKV